MHATYHKISAREREEAPRFYYKRAKARTVGQRLKGALRVVAAFIFTQVGVVALIVAYTLVGAGIFGSLEAESQMEQSREAARIRARMAKVRRHGVALNSPHVVLNYPRTLFEK